MVVGVSRNTVRRYLGGGQAAETQQRPEARSLSAAGEARAVELWHGAAERNAVVVRGLLADEGIEASVRTIQRDVK